MDRLGRGRIRFSSCVKKALHHVYVMRCYFNIVYF